MDPRRVARFSDVDECSLVAWPSCCKSGTGVPSAVYTDKPITLQETRQLIDKDLRDNAKFAEAWAAAKQAFAKQHKRQPSGDDDLKVSLIAYTMEVPVPLYRDFNERSKQLGKSDSKWASFPYKGLWYMLHRALETVPSSPSRIQRKAKITLYRGVKAAAVAKSGFDPEKIVEDEMLYSFNHFTSTSTNREVALNQFAGRGGILFEFDMVPLVSLGIRDNSVYPGEEEVLLGPWSTFECWGMRQERGTTCVGLVSAGPNLKYKFR